MSLELSQVYTDTDRLNWLCKRAGDSNGLRLWDSDRTKRIVECSGLNLSLFDHDLRTAIDTMIEYDKAIG